MASNKALKVIVPRVGATQTTPENPLHTTRRLGGTYYFRRRIPLDLVAAHCGQREVTYSLRTKDRAEAERKARRASVALDQQWAKLRAELFDAAPLESERWHGTAAEWEQAEYEHQLEAEEAERAEAETDALISKLRLAGVLLPAAAQQPAPVRTKRTTMDNLVEHWERERKPNTKTAAKMKLAVLEFNLLHKDPAVQTITRPMVIAYRTHLLGTGKAKGTIDDRLSNIGTLLALAADHGYVTTNVAARAALPPDKLATKTRIGYTPEQAAAVIAGTEQYRDSYPARYWLPRLARWTGGRLNELHQLRRQDLTERDGVRGISIIDEGEHAEGIPMRMKNAASRRWVPLHPALAEFWTWTAARPNGPLFPSVPDKHGIVSTEFSKWYGRQLRRAWGVVDKRVTFHSWRHSFADACRASGVQDSIRYALMGHAEGGAAGSYGTGELPARVLAEAVCKLPAT